MESNKSQNNEKDKQYILKRIFLWLSNHILRLFKSIWKKFTNLLKIFLNKGLINCLKSFIIFISLLIFLIFISYTGWYWLAPDPKCGEKFTKERVETVSGSFYRILEKTVGVFKEQDSKKTVTNNIIEKKEQGGDKNPKNDPESKKTGNGDNNSTNGSAKPENKTNNILGMTENILSKTSVIIAIFSVLVIVLTLVLGFFGVKWIDEIVQIRNSIKDMKKMRLDSAKLTIYGLPELIQTQQIPDKYVKLLLNIHELFRNPETRLGVYKHL